MRRKLKIFYDRNIIFEKQTFALFLDKKSWTIFRQAFILALYLPSHLGGKLEKSAAGLFFIFGLIFFSGNSLIGSPFRFNDRSSSLVVANSEALLNVDASRLTKKIKIS